MADEKIIFSMNGVGKILPHNNRVILKDIYLSFFYGAKIGIVGLNGSGKSTLMNILFGMPVIHETGGFEGAVEIGGEHVFDVVAVDGDMDFGGVAAAGVEGDVVEDALHQRVQTARTDVFAGLVDTCFCAQAQSGTSTPERDT